MPKKFDSKKVVKTLASAIARCGGDPAVIFPLLIKDESYAERVAEFMSSESTAEMILLRALVEDGPH